MKVTLKVMKVKLRYGNGIGWIVPYKGDSSLQITEIHPIPIQKFQKQI